MKQLTQLNTPPTEPEAGENHLSQAEAGTESREVADGNDTDQIEEDDADNRIGEAKEEDGTA